MVFGGHHHVLLPGLFGELRPVARGIGFGLELFCEKLVFFNRNRFVFHGPFVAAQNAVESPVNEHAESGVAPPLHALRAGSFLPRVRGRQSRCVLLRL